MLGVATDEGLVPDPERIVDGFEKGSNRFVPPPMFRRSVSW